MQKSIIVAAAWLEIAVGTAVLTLLAVSCRLLFAAEPEGVGTVAARVGGLGILSLGIACLPSRIGGSSRRAVLGLLVFNVGVAILLTWIGVATKFRGVLLWPAVVLHAVIAAALVRQLQTPQLLE